jgi:octaheme c-type cytochrome (tetrathionate reductase family)
MKAKLQIAVVLVIAVMVSFACEKKTAPKIKVIEDHKEIKGPFKTPQDVTKKCLECHDDVGEHILKTQHWNWTSLKAVQKGKKIGKVNVFNNFCIAITGNWPRCTSCHIGYGWKDKKFDFSNPENIDCLVCHDSTGTYKKFPSGAGMPVSLKDKKKVFKGNKKTYMAPDYDKISKLVAVPNRKNCGSCHFFGGGGNNVKHGDLDTSLIKPSKDVDVHMGGKNNFACTKCHKSTDHKIQGAMHASMAQGIKHFNCTDCHKGELHKKSKKMKKINKHLASVACQTCHIPEYAKVIPTKTWWDWSTAGDEKNKTPDDKYGNHTWVKKKGTFKWEKNVKPEYYWYNGKQEVTIHGDKITSNKKVNLNPQKGNIRDTNSRIMPFKIMRGKQAYDTKTKMLLVPHLFGKGGYWKTFDWNKSFAAGMKKAGLPFSGKFDWVETEMYWPLNHMVSPKEKALKCTDCHGEKSRLDWKKLGYKGDPKKTGGRKL